MRFLKDKLQVRTRVFSEDVLVHVRTHVSSALKGGGGQERADLPQLCPALQDADVRQPEDGEWLRVVHVPAQRRTQILHSAARTLSCASDFLLTEIRTQPGLASAAFANLSLKV